MSSENKTLEGRLALRPPEAAKTLGVSERTLRGMLSELPHVRRGGVVLIPLKALERWLDASATRSGAHLDAVAEEVVQSLRDDYE